MTALRALEALVAAVMLPSIVTAQTAVTLTGVVQDETGAPVPGATVRLLRAVGAEVAAVPSRPDGSFALEGVVPDVYALKVESSGFETFQQTLTVAPGVSPLRVTLRIAAIEQEVTVEAESDDILSTAASETGTTRLDEDWLRDLPIASDDLLAAIGNFVAPASQGAGGASIVVDGVEGGQLDLPSSSIDRIRLNRNPYSAVFQHPGNARVEVGTKRGHRSRYDGGVLVWDRNSIFSARNAFAQSVPPLDRHTVQAKLGGALPTRTASFYASGERFVNDESVVVNAVTLAGPFVQNVPTSQVRNSLFARVQWWPNSLHTVYGTYGLSERSYTNREAGGFNLPERGVAAARRAHKLTVNYGAMLPPNWQNNLLVNAESSEEQTGTAVTVPAIVVTGAFAGGPSPTFTGGTTRSLNLENAATYFGHARHRVIVGARIRVESNDVFDASNFGGVFEFPSLAAFAAGAPLFFRVNRGNPRVAFTAYRGSAYVQGEIRVTPRFTLTSGLRYDRESALRDANNLAPRVAFVFAPDEHKKTLLRGGAGLFYDNLPRSVIERSQLMDGVRLRELVIADPSFPDPLSEGEASSPPPSAIRLAPHIRSPYLAHTSVGIEQELWKRNWVTVDYAWVRGTHLLRARDVNAPLPGTAVRPDPHVLNITQVDATAFQRGQMLTITWRGRLRPLIDPYVQYRFAKTTNNTSGPFALPADNYDLRPEAGPADFDARHRFHMMGVMRLPYGFQSGLVLSMISGRPFTITTGFDDNGDTIANDRPAFVTRNTARGPGTVRLDLRLAKSFAFARPSGDALRHKRDTVEVGVDVFNALNRTNVTDVVGVLSSPFFGRANAAASARTIQISARYTFRR